MRLDLRLVVVLLSSTVVDGGFFMMMMKPQDGGGQQMMAASAPSASMTTTTTTTSADDSSAASSSSQSKSAKAVECVEPSVLEESVKKAQQAESSLAEEKKAMEAMRVEVEKAQKKAQELEAERDHALRAEEKAKESLRVSNEEVATLRSDLQKQVDGLSKSSNAAERMAKFQQDILKELNEVNSNSEKQLNVLKQQIDAEMKRQRERLRIDEASAERVAELEKENLGFMGELKALHQLYDRLDKKYDAKMQQEEEEKLAYFAESLDAEVAIIIGEREVEWEQTLHDLKNRTAMELNQTKTKAAEQLAQLQADMEIKAERDANATRDKYEKQVQTLEKQIEDNQAAFAKTLELQKAGGQQALVDLENMIRAEAAEEAAKVQKQHEVEISRLEGEIQKAKEETKKALENSQQIDSNLRRTHEQQEEQRKEYGQKIMALKQELHEAHEETEYWMKAFATRAYFNATQIGEDIGSFVHAARVTTVESIQEQVSRAKKSKDRGLEYVNQQTTKVAKSVDPYTRPVVNSYNKYLSKHVSAGSASFQKIYDKNVAPQLESASRFRRQKSDEFYKAMDDGFETIVALARKRCKSSQKEIDKAPKMIRDRMRKVCEKPDIVIRDALRMCVVLLIIIFRRPLWKLLCMLVRAVASFTWYMATFGFLRSKSNAVPAESASDSPMPPKTPVVPDDDTNEAQMISDDDEDQDPPVLQQTISQ